MRLPRAVLALSVAALVLSTGGCSLSVSQSELEAEVARFADDITQVDCDGDLDGEVGATQDCTATRGDGSTVDVVVTVTEVDGNDVLFDVTSAAAD